MEYLCEFVERNGDVSTDEKLSIQDFSFDEFADLDRCKEVICNCLRISNDEIEENKENLDKQRAAVISFRYKGRMCEFYEHLDSQRDYIGVRLMPV